MNFHPTVYFFNIAARENVIDALLRYNKIKIPRPTTVSAAVRASSARAIT
jgi:hypothetical protein